MIQITFENDYNLSNLGKQITTYVNNNLRNILEVLLDFINDDAFELETIFPNDYWRKNPQECKDTVNELYTIICSENIRSFIKPKYEYLLYYILQWWEDCTDDESELICNPVDDKLKEKLKEEKENNILDYIQNFKNYYDICFEDHDFLPNQLSNMVSCYLENPNLFKMVYEYDNLDDYINLMDADLRERYLEKRSNIKSNNDISFEIVKDFMSVIYSFQKRIVNFEKKGEVEITADIYDAIKGYLSTKYDLQISREFPMGRAIKAPGETDLYIYSQKNGREEDYAILENKYIENFENQYQQLMGYLNQDFKFGITVSINRKMSLKKGFDKIEKTLKNIDGTFKPIKVKRCLDGEKTIMIVSEHIVPENQTSMKVFHLIFNLNDKERKEIAISARK